MNALRRIRANPPPDRCALSEDSVEYGIVHIADRSDMHRLGAWSVKCIFDTQLGPNRNGRHG